MAVIAYGSTQRSVGRKQASQREVNPYETPFKPFLPTSAYALAASRHMHQYGTTREHLAEVAVAARKWAQLNPVAWEKKPLTVADVLKSRMISPSVHGARLLPRHRRRRRDRDDVGGAREVMKKPPAYVLGCGHGVTHMNISSMPDLTVTGAKQSGEAAYKMAKLSAKDCDMVAALRRLHHQHDPVPRRPRFLPEGRRRGVRVRTATSRRAASLPVNTNGGGLSYCHPGMYGLFILIEGVRQLRGECGERQVKKHDVAMVHGNGGVLSAQASVILGGAATV